MRKSRRVKIGKTEIGAGAPVLVQSMLSAPADNERENIAQLKAVLEAGCEIIRMAVPDGKAVSVFARVCEESSIPVAADIHFDYRLAIESLKAGASKIRINPGNIGSFDKIKKVADECQKRRVPIRIGVNSGSVEKDFLEKWGGPKPEALAQSAMRHIKILEECDFHDIVVSIKSSNVKDMVTAYKIVADECDYPLHLGVTEAGTERSSLIKSSIGIGSLLLSGIGDTIRVSMTGDCVNEVRAGFDILKALELRVTSPIIISCPTCGRTQIDLVSLAQRIEKAVKDIRKPIKIAVMGCIVNGPGEAANADIGVAGGKGYGMLFKNGKILRKVPEDKIVNELIKEIELL